MAKLTMFVMIALLIVIGAFAFFNNDTTSITVPFDKEYQIPKMGLIILSSVVGALTMFFIYAARDTRRMVLSYQVQRLQKQHDKIAGLYARAMDALLGEDQQGAQKALREILKIQPDHRDSLLRLGNVAMRAERFDEAVEFYQRVLTADGRNLEALFSLAEANRRTGQRAAALKYVEKILEIDDDNHSALVKKRTLLEADGLWKDLQAVQRVLIKIERADEGRRREEEQRLLGYRYEMAREALERGNMSEAEKGFKAIVSESQDFVPAYLGYAEVMLSDERKTDDAVTLLERAYERTGSPIVLARLEDLLLSLGEPSRLIAIYKKAIEAHPTDRSLKFFLGKLYFRLEMVDDAFAALETLEDTYVEVHKLLGELYLRRNQCEKAVTQFKKTLDMSKTYKIPYCCSSCGYQDEDWSGRCPRCGDWDTYRFGLHGACELG